MWRRLLLLRATSGSVGPRWFQPRQHRGFSVLRRRPTPETVAALRELLSDRFSTAPSVLEVTNSHAFGSTAVNGILTACARQHHGRDESYHAPAPPDGVAFIESTMEVVRVLEICAATGTPVIPFGAGSSIEGQISAKEGGVSINLTGMNQILQVLSTRVINGLNCLH